ncbi:MAG: hypothetical protein SP1CHLAM54_17770 [Chlamydiia bacterium]|nr:hypothetical protein [Chlamydiia bacterium]MCH9616665.1 hypothetical protein [Chlamydiia bacterium]MCH9629397.1 hypothetical protein [Chlamydiia bacterium]
MANAQQVPNALEQVSPNGKLHEKAVLQRSRQYGCQGSGLEEAIESIVHGKTSVKKINYALVVIMVMVLIGMDGMQDQIADRSNAQNKVSGLQTNAAQMENYINKLLQQVTKGGGPSGGGGLPSDFYKTGKPGAPQNVAQLQSFMKEVYKMFYSYQDPSGGSSDTWQNAEIILPKPIMVNGKEVKVIHMYNSDGTANKQFRQFFVKLREEIDPSITQESWYDKSSGAIDWPKAKAAGYSGIRLPWDTFSTDAKTNAADQAAFAKMQMPGIMQMALAQLQVKMDTDYGVSSVDDATFMKVFGDFASNSGIAGLSSMYQQLNSQMSKFGMDNSDLPGWVMPTGISGSGNSYNGSLLDIIVDYVRSQSKDFAGQNPTVSGQNTDLHLMEGAMEYLAHLHYLAKDQGSSTSSTPTDSPLDDFTSTAAQAQTYLQTQTQTNTAEIQQDIQTNQSYDKIGQTIVSSVTQGTKTMVSNQMAR